MAVRAQDDYFAGVMRREPDHTRLSSFVRAVSWIMRPIGVGIAIVAALMLLVNGLL